MRLKSEARYALEELAERWKCSKTAAVERMILKTHEALKLGLSTPSESLPPARVKPESIPGVQVGAGERKNATCRHCGQRFTGAKYATICRACEDGGHLGEPRDCGVCTEGSGI